MTRRTAGSPGPADGGVDLPPLPTGGGPTGATDRRVAHTPGPWRVDGGRCGPKSDRLMVVHGAVDTISPIICDVHNDGGLLPRDANAHLIAAAPDLLVVARGLVAASEGGEMSVGLIRMAYAAVARAEGGAA